MVPPHRSAAGAAESAGLQRLLRDALVDARTALDAAQLESEANSDTPGEGPEISKLTWNARILALLSERAFPARRAGAWLPPRSPG